MKKPHQTTLFIILFFFATSMLSAQEITKTKSQKLTTMYNNDDISNNKLEQDRLSKILAINHFQSGITVHPDETVLDSYKTFLLSFSDLFEQLNNNEVYQLPTANRTITFSHTKIFDNWKKEDARSAISDADGNIYTLSLEDKRIKPLIYKSFSKNGELLIWTISADFRYVKGTLYFKNGETYIFEPLAHYRKNPEVISQETTFIAYNVADDPSNQELTCHAASVEQNSEPLIPSEPVVEERITGPYQCDFVVAFMTNTNMLTKYGTVAALEAYIANLVALNVPRWDNEFPVHLLNYISSGNFIQMGTNAFVDDLTSAGINHNRFNNYLTGVNHILPGAITAMSYAYITDISISGSSAVGVATIGTTLVIPGSSPVFLAALCNQSSGLCLFDGSSTLLMNKILTHEIGHQLGKNHVPSSDCNICYMNSSVNISTNQWYTTTVDTIDLFLSFARNAGFCVLGCSMVLPVELTAFTATASECEQVELFWETASEINSDYFELEKSYNGRDWFSVTKIAAGGTTFWEKQYKYIDTKNIRRSLYYRLKQYDLDGTEAIFSVVSINIENCTKEFNLYPSPTSGAFTLSFAECEKIQIFDFSGRKIKELSVENLSDDFLEIDLSGFGGGVYKVVFFSGNVVNKILSVVVE